MRTRQEIAEEVLETVRLPVLKLGIELDVTYEWPSGTWQAVAYNGKRSSRHIWVHCTEQDLRRALRETLEDYLADLTTDAMGSFDDALDAHDTARDAAESDQNIIPAISATARPAEKPARGQALSDGGA